MQVVDRVGNKRSREVLEGLIQSFLNLIPVSLMIPACPRPGENPPPAVYFIHARPGGHGNGKDQPAS